MNNKLQELTKKRNLYKEKLKEMYKYFHGVRHENSLSELRYSQIKVYEDIISSLETEINKLKNAK